MVPRVIRLDEGDWRAVLDVAGELDAQTVGTVEAADLIRLWVREGLERHRKARGKKSTTG
jgi:hypothetical protein